MRQIPPRAEFSVGYAGANLSTDFIVKKGKDFGKGYTGEDYPARSSPCSGALVELSEIEGLGLQNAQFWIAGAHFDMMIATFGLKRWMIA